MQTATADSKKKWCEKRLPETTDVDSTAVYPNHLVRLYEVSPQCDTPNQSGRLRPIQVKFSWPGRPKLFTFNIFWL